MPDNKIVWLASYPKSGNTWVRLLLGNLLGSGEGDEDDDFNPVAGISSSRLLFERQVGLDSLDLSADEADLLRPDLYRMMASKAKEPLFVKAHDSFHSNKAGDLLFPADASSGAVYIVRNPLDVAVSHAHHRGEDTYEKSVRLLNNRDAFIGGGNGEQLRQLLSDWSTHYRSWVSQREIPVLVVRYEDLRKDTSGWLKKIAHFVGLAEKHYALPIEDAVDAARFERLQELEAQKGFREKPLKSKRFFRSGKSGEGSQKLSSELQDSIVQHHGAVMRELGYLEREESEQ